MIFKETAIHHDSPEDQEGSKIEEEIIEYEQTIVMRQDETDR